MANVFTIAATAPFAETLARGLMAQRGTRPLALADVTIYLPTRRAQRTFGDAFARILGGAALLPEFRALGGAADEDEFLFEAEALDLPPAIEPIRRTLLLAKLVEQWHRSKHGKDIGFPQAVAMAEGLGRVMDDVETQGASLAALDVVIPEDLADHWQDVRNFLTLLETHWPPILEAEGKISPVARRDSALRALARRLTRRPPGGPVIAAGSTGSIPATAELLKAIAELPNGAVVLPGLDREMDDKSWRDLDPGHPQYGMRQLLERIGIKRAAVQDWASERNAPREWLLREALRPAPTTDAWRSLADDGHAPALAEGAHGIALIEAADAREEALAIAVAMRATLETANETVALVTPDRNLARRVATELKRWDIAVEDSAGQPLAHTLQGSFLCLLCEAAAAQFAPVPLFALLKHDLCAAWGIEDQRRNVDRLDRDLRGPRPDPGLDGIRSKIARLKTTAASEERRDRLAKLEQWWESLAALLRPLEEAMNEREAPITLLLHTHMEVAQKLAGSNLWRAEGGEAAADLVNELMESADAIPAIEPSAYPPLFRKLALAKAVRFQRSGHPRLAILGPLEARLQRFDTVILGGLNEGTWPAATPADPWFSRPMRKAMGLEPPERGIGQSAHDFAMLCGATRVLFTRAQKNEGVPTVPSRWVQRLMQLTAGLGLDGILAAREHYVRHARALCEAGQPVAERPPHPTPPLESRPTTLSVTDIEKWVRDPYAIYARRILKLEDLKGLDETIGPLERGNAIHKTMERFVDEMPAELPADAAVTLCGIADEVFAREGTSKAALALWRPRFVRAAQWFVGIERQRRANIVASHTEIKGECEIIDGFTLRGTADRIDVLSDGTAVILDYKTGAVPSDKQIAAFLAPQLLLEAAMLKFGAFPDVQTREAAELLYVQIQGGKKPGEVKAIDAAMRDETLAKLIKRVLAYREVTAPYPSRVAPQQARFVGNYDHLARVREWSLSGWEPES